MMLFFIFLDDMEKKISDCRSYYYLQRSSCCAAGAVDVVSFMDEAEEALHLCKDNQRQTIYSYIVNGGFNGKE